MDELRRREYLQALGVDLWLRRDARAAPATQVAGPAVAEAPPLRQPLPPAAPPREGPAEVPPLAAVAAEPPRTPPIEVPCEWAPLRALVAGCERCGLCRTRTQTVFGAGVETAPLMVVGEGPGADEDARGEPFVGRAGRLLDEMLRSIGHARADNTYIANVVKCRPPNNRDPLPAEAEACRPYLEAQLQLVQPKLILAVGRIAAQRLLRTDEALSRLRGRLHHWGPQHTPLWITYHPAYLLRSPREKAKAWADLKFVHRFLREVA